MDPLLSLAAIFVLSLVGAVVLFKYLQSTAIIKKKGWQASGAVAGFILIFGLLAKTYDEIRKPDYSEWTIKGVVEKADAPIHDGITVKHRPPITSTLSDKSGDFVFENVKIFPKEPTQDLNFELEGYFPYTQPLNDDAITKDKKTKTIILKNKVVLQRITK